MLGDYPDAIFGVQTVEVILFIGVLMEHNLTVTGENAMPVNAPQGLPTTYNPFEQLVRSFFGSVSYPDISRTLSQSLTSYVEAQTENGFAMEKEFCLNLAGISSFLADCAAMVAEQPELTQDDFEDDEEEGGEL